MLLVPDGYALKDPNSPSDPYGYKDLGPQGSREPEGVGCGAAAATSAGSTAACSPSALGISQARSTATAATPASRPPGALSRVRVNDGSPLAAGVGPFAWVLDDARYVLSSGAGAGIPLRYPDAGSSDFFVSGQADGAAALGGRPAATRRARWESGRVVAFGFDPNFRAFADGTEKLLRNALFGADPAIARASAARKPAGHAAGDPRHAHADGGQGPRCAWSCAPAGARAAKRVLARFGADYRVQRGPQAGCSS